MLEVVGQHSPDSPAATQFGFLSQDEADNDDDDVGLLSEEVLGAIVGDDLLRVVFPSLEDNVVLDDPPSPGCWETKYSTWLLLKAASSS